MEKYAVELDETQTKEAAESRGACPSCGAALPPVEHINVPKCDKCGTAPFEKK